MLKTLSLMALAGLLCTSTFVMQALGQTALDQATAAIEDTLDLFDDGQSVFTPQEKASMAAKAAECAEEPDAETGAADSLDDCAASVIMAEVETNMTAWRDAALKHFNDKTAEPSIVEAIWSDTFSFWVSMRPNGSRRDGFAEYVCVQLGVLGKPDNEAVSISIWDAHEMASGNLKKIGSKGC